MIFNNSFVYYLKKLLRTFKIKEPRYSSSIINNRIEENKLSSIEITAKKGALILFDSSYIHKGKIIEKGERYTFTNYYFLDSEKSINDTTSSFGKLFVK